jgi:tetratricopeptide (TPR) repeat protein
MKDINYDKVKSCINESKFLEALPILMEELNNNPDDCNVNSLIGFCYRAINDYDKSEKYYLTATKLNPNDYSSFLGLGIVYQLKEDFSKAISALNRAINIIPQKIEAVNSLGFTYKKMGDIKSALVEYNRAIKILNDSAFNYLKENNPKILGTSKDGKTFEVNPTFFVEIKKLLKSNILYATLMNNIGGCFVDLGQLQKAKECFLESLEFIPEGVKYEPPIIGLKHIEKLGNK